MRSHWVFRGNSKAIKEYEDGKLRQSYPTPDARGNWRWGDQRDTIVFTNSPHNLAQEILYMVFDRQTAEDPVNVDAFWREVLSQCPKRWDLTEKEIRKWFADWSAWRIDPQHRRTRHLPFKSRRLTKEQSAEQVIRDGFLRRLNTDFGYPAENIGKELPIFRGSILIGRADLVVFYSGDQTQDNIFAIIEVKTSNRDKDRAFAQLVSYMIGDRLSVFRRHKGESKLVNVERLPSFLESGKVQAPPIHDGRF